MLTGKVSRLEGDHLVGVWFGILRLAVPIVLQRWGRRGDNSLWDQSSVFGPGHVLINKRGQFVSSTLITCSVPAPHCAFTMLSSVDSITAIDNSAY